MPPKIVIGLVSTTVTEEKTAEFSVKVRGKPTPTLKWLFTVAKRQRNTTKYLSQVNRRQAVDSRWLHSVGGHVRWSLETHH